MTLVGERPTLTDPRAFEFPAFDRIALDNGATVITCHIPERTVLSVVGLVEGGADREDESRAGLAALTARVLTEATGSMDAASFAAAFEGIGADLAGRASREQTRLDMQVPRSRFEQGLRLLVAALTSPTFPEASVARLKAERLAQFTAERAQPAFLASLAFLQEVYEAGTLHARQSEGLPDTVAALTQATLVEHYDRFVKPDVTTLVVAGDIAGLPVQALATELLGGWSGAAERATAARPREIVGDRRVSIVHRPGSVQSNIVVGHGGIDVAQPDHLAAEVMNHMLGGWFGSRINMRLREEKGYTYGSRSAFNAGRLPGPWMLSAPVETSVTAAAIDDLLDVIDATRAHGFDEDEIAKAKTHIAGTSALQFEIAAGVAEGIANIVHFGWPDDYHSTFGRAVEALSAEQLDAALQTHVRPHQMAIVVVGDADAIKGPIEATGAGPVTVVEA